MIDLSEKCVMDRKKCMLDRRGNCMLEEEEGYAGQKVEGHAGMEGEEVCGRQKIVHALQKGQLHAGG